MYMYVGSYDGYVRLWNVNASENRTLTPHLALPVDGFVNSLALSSSLVVAGTGQEHRLGRYVIRVTFISIISHMY